MKKAALISVHLFTAAVLLAVACSDHPVNLLKGEWMAEDGKHQLKITDKTFAINAQEHIAEDYFVKGDTIYTSFQGNQPYTQYVIRLLDDEQLTLSSPDDDIIKFKRK